jgi:hypothetical protein
VTTGRPAGRLRVPGQLIGFKLHVNYQRPSWGGGDTMMEEQRARTMADHQRGNAPFAIYPANERARQQKKEDDDDATTTTATPARSN